MSCTAAGVLLAGCGRHVAGVPVENQRPIVSLSGGPAPLSDVLYTVRLRWTGLDPDGEIVAYQYAVDPPADADTTWTTLRTHEATLVFPSTDPPDPLPPSNQRVTARDQHAFVLRARDNEGLLSEPVIRSFTSRTIVPNSTIFRPRPTVVPVATLPSVTIEWTGLDLDGPPGQKPLGYHYKLVPAYVVHPSDPTYVPASRVQEYFGAEALAGFPGWGTTGPDTTRVTYEGLDLGRTYVFVVSAWDEAGAAESRFLPSSNALQFKPTLNSNGPRMTVFNTFFRQTLPGGVSLEPNRIIPLEIPSDRAVTFQWFGTPATGAQMAGYRWVLDVEGGLISNETPRVDDQDVHHWSAWSLEETAATIGPFTGTPGEANVHFFYVMGRDNVGFPSLFTIELRVIAPDRQRDLLVVDDRYGPYNPMSGPFPTEAEEDTFHFAVGGVPDLLTGGISQPGTFAGLDFDTLDYRNRPVAAGPGVPLSVLARYRAVAWYTDAYSGAVGSGSSTNPPPIALRYINTPEHMNTLALWLEQGGKLLLFGEGAPIAIATGYWSGFSRLPPTFPYTGSNVLRPGSFLHDFVHLRSTLNYASLTGQRLRGAIPNLPEFRGAASTADRTHDPRIGPGAERTAARWSGLPRLSLAAYRGAAVDPGQRWIAQTWNIGAPMQGIEGAGAGASAVVDTLYLFQSELYDPTNQGTDGKPNAIHYHGSQHGEVVWLGFPLYYFEPDQARTLVRRVMSVFGVETVPGAPGR